jgi:DNA processing protein
MAPAAARPQSGRMKQSLTDGDLDLWLRLRCARGVGAITADKLYRHFGSVDKLFGALEKDFPDLGGDTATVLNALHDPRTAAKAASCRDRLEISDSIRVLTADQPEFPERLRRSAQLPLVLFVRGELRPAKAWLAVVGSRKATVEGQVWAREWSQEWSQNGITVVSGLALGIDAAAHKGALAAEKPTVAVLGTGPEKVYPAIHQKLAENILMHGGALISQFLPGTAPNPGTFPARNTVIAGLSDAVLVVEAKAGSGALTTAADAARLGRSVYAVPSHPDHPDNQGALALLKSGARAVTKANDLLQSLLGLKSERTEVALPDLDEDEGEVLRALDHVGQFTDELAAKLYRPTHWILNVLLRLELLGLVEQRPGKRFVRLR